ncbi:MAG: hypothetical protein JO099_25055 [Acidobacteriia bacterium]|nr:hypothetical protein [Terriglobia bacterium]
MWTHVGWPTLGQFSWQVRMAHVWAQVAQLGGAHVWTQVAQDGAQV